MVTERVSRACSNAIDRERVFAAIRQLQPVGETGRIRLAATERRISTTNLSRGLERGKKELWIIHANEDQVGDLRLPADRFNRHRCS